MIKKIVPTLILIILLTVSLNLALGQDSIRGNYSLVGQIPKKNSLKNIIFEEFINFGCSHCNKLHKASKNFRIKYSEKVKFIDIPILFRGQNDAPLRLYFIAKKIGKGNLVKNELFKASFENEVNVFDPGIVNFLARSLGINKEFQTEKQKDWVNELIAEGKIKAEKYRITGTPTIIIQQAMKMDIGQYGSMSNFIKKIPETIEDLIK